MSRKAKKLPLRIGMSGTGGVGKSTVLAAIKESYPDLVQPISSARAVFAQRGITEADQREMPGTALLELQEAITSHWLAQFKAMEGQDSIWDRTMLDHYAYGVVRNHQSVDRAWLAQRDLQTRVNLFSYSHFFYFPMPSTWEPSPDPVRDPAPGTRKLVDIVQRGFLAQLPGFEVHVVPTDAKKEDVIRFVLDRIATP